MSKLLGFCIACVVGIAALVAPGSALAGPPPGVPGAWCDWSNAANCYQYQDGDVVTSKYEYGNDRIYRKDIGGNYAPGTTALGCNYLNQYGNPAHISSTSCSEVPGRWLTYKLERMHKYNTHAFLRGDYTVFVPTDGSSQGIALPEWKLAVVISNPQQNQVDCEPYVNAEGGSTQLNAGAPQELYDVCVKKYDPPATTDPTACDPYHIIPCTTQPTNPSPPTEQGTCDDVKVAKKGKVKVTRSGLSCFVARTTIAKYLKSSQDPDGYVCVSLRSKHTVTGKCVASGDGKSGKAKATVVGRYRI